MKSSELILANSIKKDLEHVDVDIAVSNVSPDMTEFDVTMTMKAGVAYCCMDSGCFLATQCKSWFEDLHERLKAEGLTVPLMTVRSLRVVMEKGSIAKPTRGTSGYTCEETNEYVCGPFRETEAQ